MFKGMKSLVAALGVTSVLVGASAAQAAITFDPDGVGGAAAIANVGGFDWAPGNVLSVGGQAAVNNLLATTPVFADGNGNAFFYNSNPGDANFQFTSYYQAKLGQLQLTTGGSADPQGWEITVVAKVRETLTSVLVQGGQATASFDVVADPENYIEIYAHRIGDVGTTVANDLAGTGFNDGNLILKGVIDGGASSFTRDLLAATQNLDGFGSDNYPTIDSVVSALGSVTIQPLHVDVTFLDNDYFNSALESFSLAFIATSQVPFSVTDPSANFLVNSGTTAEGVAPSLAGAGNPLDPTYGIGPVNGESGPSFQFLADGNSAVNGSTPVIPEPATAAMGLIGLAGLAMASRRRR